MSDDLQLEDRIYEAAATPELWPDVLERLMQLADCTGAVMVLPKGADFSWIATSEEFAQLVNDHYAHRDGPERTRKLLATRHPGFVSEHSLWSPEEIAKNTLYQELLIPRGYGRSVATAVISPPGETYVFHAEGPYRLGPISQATLSRLDEYRPHLARAAHLSARLGLERARAIADVLEKMNFPAAILDGRARMLSCTSQFLELVPSVVEDRSQGIRFVNDQVDKRFSKSFRSSIIGGSYSSPLSFLLDATSARPPALIHLIPLRSASNLFFQGRAVITVCYADFRSLPEAPVLAGLFDLSPAEARVAKALGEGFRISEIADRNHVKESTVRVQVKAILEKTGARRQSTLVGWLQNASLGRNIATAHRRDA